MFTRSFLSMLFIIQFLHPAFLFGLFLLAIPIILHLFSFKRYKKVYFSNFNFLAALQQQKKNSSKLKNLLLLLLRLAVIACIVLAFASPYLTSERRQVATEQPQVVIYADNSFSMTNTGSQGSLLEEAKKQLFDLVNSYPAGTGFRLLTNETVNQLLLNKDQLLQMLGNLKISPASKSLAQVWKEISELTKNQTSTIFIVSDFQKKEEDLQPLVSDSTTETILLVLKPENLNNIYIDQIYFDQTFHKKDQNDRIHISIVNASDREFHHIPVTLSLNDKKKSIHQIDLPANSQKILDISYQNVEEGFYKGTVEVSDFPMIFDNKFYFSYGTNGNANILYVWQNRANPYFGKLFSDSTTFNFTSTPVGQTANLLLSRYHLIILDGVANRSSGFENTLEEYLRDGGNLFILPGEMPIENQNQLLQKIQAPIWGSRDTGTVISQIETQASLFRDVFEQEDSKAVLPHVHHFYPLSLPDHSEKLLQDKRNHTLLASQTFGKGNIYVSAFSYDPGNSDMVYHPLFVPLLVNMAFNVNSTLNTSYFLNSDQPVILNNKNYTENIPLQVRRTDKTFEFVSEIRKDFSGNLLLSNAHNIQDAGLYEAVQEERVVDALAWNYDRSESQMTFYSEEDLAKYFPAARIENIKTTQLDKNSQLIKEIVLHDNNKYLTPWFLVLAVILLLLEQVVWRRKLQ